MSKVTCYSDGTDVGMSLWFVEKVERDESIATEADMSLVSSLHSSSDIDMLPDAHLADGLEDAGCYCMCDDSCEDSTDLILCCCLSCFAMHLSHYCS